MNIKQLREFIIQPILKYLNLYSKEAEDLLVGTCCAESLCGEYIKQINGPALGIFQMELKTAEDIENNYLKYREQLRNKIDFLRIPALSLEENLISNLSFQVALCRVHYLRNPDKIPSSKEELAKYWKKYYNTYKGKGTEEEFLERWKRFENF